MEMLNIVWILRGIPYEKVKIAMYGYLAGKHKLSASTEEVAASVEEISSSSAITASQLEEAAGDIQIQVSTLQEITAVSSDLNDRANSLQEVVNKFKI